MPSNSPHRHVHKCSWSFLGIPLATYALAMSAGYAGLMPYVSWDLDFSMMVSVQRIDCSCSKPHGTKISVCITELSHSMESWVVRGQWVRDSAKQRAWYCYEENLRFLVNTQNQKCLTSQLTSAKFKCKDRIQYFQQKLFFFCEKVINDISQYTTRSIYYILCFAKPHDDILEHRT